MTKTEKATEKAIARYRAGGGNESHGRALLADLLERLSVQNLPTALVYMGFATTRSADRLTADLCGGV